MSPLAKIQLLHPEVLKTKERDEIVDVSSFYLLRGTVSATNRKNTKISTFLGGLQDQNIDIEKLTIFSGRWDKKLLFDTISRIYGSPTVGWTKNCQILRVLRDQRGRVRAEGE